jgi:cbb3-type cytochrome oxidase subunit 3
MSLTEIMSSAGLTFWPIAGLVLFLLAFVMIGVRTFARGSKQSQSEAARLPLEEARVISTSDNNTAGGAL